MQFPIDHDWPKTAAEAVTVQQALRHRVQLSETLKEVRTVAGVDVSYDPASNKSFAFVVLMRWGEWAPIAAYRAVRDTDFPYIPGFLSFREVPVVLDALAQLKETPDLLMVDGQGIAHPRRFGIAAHLGVLTDLPTIGVAKSLLCGHHAAVPEARGAQVELKHKGEVIGTVLRSKLNCKPLIVSPGHLVNMKQAADLTCKALTRYRLPEPTRLADKFSKSHKSDAPLLV